MTMSLNILAEGVSNVDRLRGMQERFSTPVPDVLNQIAILLCIFGVVVLTIWTVAHVQKARSKEEEQPQPLALYNRVQSKLGLSIWQQWWLWRLAKVLHLKNPTALLISPTRFDQAVKRYCATNGWIGSRASAATHFAPIRHRLFGEVPL